MWSVLTKIFNKNNNNHTTNNDNYQQDSGEVDVAVGNDRCINISIEDMDDTQSTKQAKQRASVKWLLSKAFNNKVPENLKEPFYKDHENQEHLKPQIVGGLANAEIYCSALANIYSDPNYNTLNHTSILQTLARKCVTLSESQLTETILIQTNPLRMSAHMAVIESIMTLYAKEVVTSDRVLAAVQRFNYGRYPTPSTPENNEQGLFLWMSHACDALRKRIEQDLEQGHYEGEKMKAPELLPAAIREIKDLSDGVGLAALISYYCPDELQWTDIKVSYIRNVQDSLYNLNLVQDFCNRCLPASIFHITPEDVTYFRDSLRQNIIVFLADLFNVTEIHPAKCVRYPGMEKFSNEGFPPRNEHGVAHKRNLLQTVMTPIPDLRSGLDDPSAPTAFQVTRSTPTHMPLRKTNSAQQSMSEMSEDSLRRNSEDSFVVHRSKNIPTLRSIVHDEPLIPSRLKPNKETQNNDSKADERGEDVAAGRPSNWEDNRKSTFAGRRSRRNSMSDDSQLTIENFGGSQDNLNFIGRNPDKEVAIHVGRKISAPSFPTENLPIRSSIQDARGTLQIGYDNGCEKFDDGTEKYTKLKRQLSSDDISLRHLMNQQQTNKEAIIKDVLDGEITNRMSFADLNKSKMIGGGGGGGGGDHGGIHLVYMQHDKEELPLKKSTSTTNGSNPEKKTTFAALPNTTTWQQQSTSNNNNNQQLYDDTNGESDTTTNTSTAAINSAQLTDVRLKLEEKRRMIESEKRRIEMAMNKQRQKVGKAAFLQAVVKGRGNLLKTPPEAESKSDSATGSDIIQQSPTTESAPPKPQRPFTLQEINDDAVAVERKWLDGQPFIETRRTPDLDNMDMEQYQQSIANMNSSLYDIQSDIQRLASQQNQIQVAQQQQIQALQQQHHQQQHHQQQQQQHYQSIQQAQYSQQHLFNHPQSQQMYSPALQTSASAPHIPQSLYQQSRIAEQPQFFLHDHQQPPPPVTPPIAPQRRTWAQQPLPSVTSQDLYQPELRTWNKMQNTGGFVLHDTTDRYESPKFQPEYRYLDNSKYQNGDEHSLQHSNSFTLSQQHHQQQQQQHHQYGTSHSTPSASPQHRNIHRQISQLMDDGKRTPVSLQQIDRDSPRKIVGNIIHAPIPTPPADDMEPQNISFIGNANEPQQQISEDLGKLNIMSGSRTYSRRISPTRPTITRNSFQPSPSPPASSSSLREENESVPIAEISSLDKDPTNQKGFYIQFDDDQPKRPKPPLRTKKCSPKKERSYSNIDDADLNINSNNNNNNNSNNKEPDIRLEKKKQLERELDVERIRREDERRQTLIEQKREQLRMKHEASQRNQEKLQAEALIIETDTGNTDPDLAERMKKRILLASLQRKQEQEEAKAKKEHEAQARREREKAKEEEKQRKKQEQAARRAAILEQYKLKKAIEEAEREGKVVDRSEYMGSLKPVARMRPKAAPRPRPKTIHIDSGSVEMAEGMLQPSRGKKGSTTNLTANSTMKRDYYRGSQDSLADRSMSSGMLYRDSPDDSRGMSPCHSANQTLGRRSSYKTSRDPSPAQVRGRPKYSNYQNFKGRKSSSLMNLYGSSTDQDSLAYRYGDTDSGLGRATPPRRAPSPGMGGSMRHLPSPSGPGSLPGLMSKGRRIFDDGSSDISSTPSSMMDYNGPRLYKQPATKSNRGIMLNAVEYCVFPGVVNREAKKRVLEEINRSESKHFLILFRDAGCQFRALYSYCPDREEVTKLYGTGPKQVNDRMFDKFFKYNSGGKCFSQVHTKHLTVTIDAFTIHNSLWQGKKVNLPNKKDMALVI